MFGPGVYRPDPSAGITAPADLPQPEIVPYSRHAIRPLCPRCGHAAYRDKQSHRTRQDLGNLAVWCPRDLLVTYAQHSCTQCRKYLSAALSALAPPGSQDTHRVIDLAVRIVVEDGVPSRPARVGTSGATPACACPLPRSNPGSRRGEKKAQSRMDTEFLDGALADFSGDVAADAL